jgi:hypothetical protein
MYSSEKECILESIDKPSSYVDNLIKEVEGGIVFKNTAEARVIIEKEASMLKDQ